MLHTNNHTVTIKDRDEAVLGSLTTLGNASGDGTLAAPNALLLEAGKTVNGDGTIVGDFIIDGTISPGNVELLSSAGRISVSGNVEINGTFVADVGAGTDLLDVTGSIVIRATSELEVNALDAIGAVGNHTRTIIAAGSPVIGTFATIPDVVPASNGAVRAT